MLLDETVLRIEEAAHLAKVHFTSAYRWILRGVPGPDGRRVKLEAVRVGRAWLTSREALQRFSDALTPQPDAQGVITPPRTHRARRKASERAARQLEAAGV
jgi:hypothetical protein